MPLRVGMLHLLLLAMLCAATAAATQQVHGRMGNATWEWCIGETRTTRHDVGCDVVHAIAIACLRQEPLLPRSNGVGDAERRRYRRCARSRWSVSTSPILMRRRFPVFPRHCGAMTRTLQTLTACPAFPLVEGVLRYIWTAARGVGTHRHAVLQLAVPERRRPMRQRAVRGRGRTAAGIPSRAHGGGGVCGGGLRARRQLRRAAGLQVASRRAGQGGRWREGV
jgi:hypothetical protein